MSEDNAGQPCTDMMCESRARGIPHVADAHHVEMLATLREIRAMKPPTYQNVELGYRGKDVGRQPYLTPAYRAMLQAQADKDKPHGLHWLWFFAAAILVIAPLEGWAIWLILR